MEATTIDEMVIEDPSEVVTITTDNPEWDAKFILLDNAVLLKLETSDEKIIEVPRPIAEMSVTIRNLLGDLEDEDEVIIPVTNVTAVILAKVIHWCTHHYLHSEDFVVAGSPEVDRYNLDLHPWDEAFCKVDQDTLFEIILAANYLDIAELLDTTCKATAILIKGKTPEEIRKVFNIKNDFTPEEEAQIRKENEWCQNL